MSRSPRTIVRYWTLAVVAVLIVGCGSGQKHLSVSEEANLARINVAFDSTALNGSHYGETLKGIDEVIALCRAKRAALVNLSKGRETVKQVVEDDANTLRPYQRDLAAQLDRVLNDNCS